MTENYKKYTEMLDKGLRPGVSYDIMRRQIKLSDGKESIFYYITSFVKETIMQKIMEFYVGSKITGGTAESTPYMQIRDETELPNLINAVMSGCTVFIYDGMDNPVILDTREYPTRAIAEPENDRVLRGPREGFCEVLKINITLIRRRIRDPMLTVELQSIGRVTKTDVALCYIEGLADEKSVKALKEKFEEIKNISAINMGHESLAESLIKNRWYNPFPKIRYTERPDAVAAMLEEGSIIIVCDNSPSAMILPTSIFDFLQESDDFYFPPFVGTYLRLLRQGVYVIAVIFTPLWYLMISNPEWLPPWLDFIKVSDPYSVPILLQLYLVEFMVDGLKLASLNTPSTLNNSLSLVGGLILGDLAVTVGWLIPEVILYMAIVSLSNFTQASYELGYAFKFMRMLMLAGIAVAGVWGFAAGFLIMVTLMATNKTVPGTRGYLYPLIPFNFKALYRLFFRVKL